MEHHYNPIGHEDVVLRDVSANQQVSGNGMPLKPPAGLRQAANRLAPTNLVPPSAAHLVNSAPQSAHNSRSGSFAADFGANTYGVNMSDDGCVNVSNAESTDEAAAVAAVIEEQMNVSPGRTDYSDPTHVGQYCSDIVQHLMDRERTLTRDPLYLTRQPEITERMRTILIDWLVDVHLKFKLHSETFFLAIDVVDRYLMTCTGQRSTLQLVGITATLLAAKHEEIYPPEIKDCEYISADTYKRPQILQMERDITAALNFRFTVPTPYPIMCRLMEVINGEPEVRCCAQFFLETAAMDYNMLNFLPSRIAIAALVLGIMTAELNLRGNVLYINQIWDRNFDYYTHGATVDEVLPCAASMLSYVKTITQPSSKYQATKRKFKSSKFLGVASYQLPDVVSVE